MIIQVIKCRQEMVAKKKKKPKRHFTSDDRCKILESTFGLEKSDIIGWKKYYL